MTSHRGPNPSRQTPGFHIQQVGRETLVYDERTHQAFCLNPVATETWRRFDGLATPAALAAAVSAALATPVTEQAVMLAIAELRGHGLLEQEPVAVDKPVPTRRDLMRQIGAGAIALLPAVAVVMAPTAAQAYNGCVNCNAVQQNSSISPAQRRAAAQASRLAFLPVPDTTGSTDDVRKKRQKNGEIWVP